MAEECHCLSDTATVIKVGGSLQRVNYNSKKILDNSIKKVFFLSKKYFSLTS